MTGTGSRTDFPNLLKGSRAPAKWRSDADDRRFTAERIHAVLAAVDEGASVADVCVAEHISSATYHFWQARYRGLPVDQIERLRRRERRKTGSLLAASGFAVAAVGVVYAFIVAAAVPPNPALPAVAAAPAKAEAAFSAAPTPAAPVVKTVTPSPGAVAVEAATSKASAPTSEPANAPISAAPSSAAVTAASAPPAAAPDKRRYMLQLAAVPTAAEADALVAQLIHGGFKASISKTSGPVTLHRVRVGPVEGRDAAEETARRLRQDGYPDPWITR